MSVPLTRGPVLFAVETCDMPGKIRMRFVTFTEEIIDIDPRFNNKRYTLLDQTEPMAAELRAVMGLTGK